MAFRHGAVYITGVHGVWRWDGRGGFAASAIAALIACGDDSAPARVRNVGAEAIATLVALPGIEESPVGLPYGGTARFSETIEGVDLYLEFTGCESYRRYPVRIVDTGDCGAIATAEVWSSGRGAGVPDGGCWASTGRARTYYSRPLATAADWSVGDGSASDVLERSLVVYDPRDPARPLACGAIERVPGTPPEPATLAPLPAVRTEVKAQFAGSCLGMNAAAGWTDSCPNQAKLVACASAHCGLDACLRHCREHALCLESSDDLCNSTCTASEPECFECMGEVVLCAVNGFCADELACSPPPTPGGPCSEVEACCKQQGERAETCLRFAHQLARQGGGDAACVSLAYDEDFRMNLIYDPPCSWSFNPIQPPP